jgi:probable F420-dependent oxidoreductase
MRVGIQLPEVEREVRWPEYLELARAAEAAGFDSIWVGDHLLYPPEFEGRGTGTGAGAARPERGPWEAWTLLSALAAVTQRVQLGPLVACLGFHAPALVAKMAATVDEVSAGRLVLGIGAGWNRGEFDAFGLPYDRRVSRFADAVAILRPLLAGERVTHEGAFWQARDAVLLPPPARRVPLMVGSNGPRMLALTLPWADAWNTWYDDYGNTAEGFAALNARISAAAREAGRDPATLRRSACAFVLLDRAAPERAILPEAPPIEGDAAAVAARLRELGDAGADEVILVVSPITVESVRVLGEVVARL